ncbi:MAG: SDR family oxidoreductase [Anaerolineae bacterium]|nr:SDR family oxidoreductase [Anaerolineae bacterium]
MTGTILKKSHNGRLAGKIALVTGGGRGIGRAIAEHFAAEGAAVTITARSVHEIEDAAAAIRAAGGHALAVQTDIADVAQVERAVQATVDAFQGLDILVNNAAISYYSDFVKEDWARWLRVLEVNLLGAVHAARAAARVMIAQGRGGRIINVSSVHGFLAENGASHYDVAKGGMDQLTRTLAVELAPHNVLVNGIAPGFVRTRLSILPDGTDETETPLFKEYYVGLRKIPLARAAAPEEIAPVALFLASPECTYVTGQILVVDGGLSITF